MSIALAPRAQSRATTLRYDRGEIVFPAGAAPGGEAGCQRRLPAWRRVLGREEPDDAR